MKLSLPLDGPVVLRIAADVRRRPTDYANDHIWEILPGGEPPGLALTTTFGRRAASMRIFPGFGMGGPVVADPSSFVVAPTLEALLPGYLELRFTPLDGLPVRYEVRAVDSQTVAGRLTVKNATDRFRPVRLVVYAQLMPLPGGNPMLPRSFEGVTTLAGRSGDLEPVLFLGGGVAVEPGRVASLTVLTDLAPGAGRSYTWGAASAVREEDSFSRARSAVGEAWDAETARLERTHAGWVEVESGEAAWDAAFHIGQQSALSGFVGPGSHSSYPALVLQRAPERGHSPRGDGRDHTDGWDGPSALEAYYVVRQMVAAAPELAVGVLRAFWDSQTADGSVDARPGPAGQRQRLLCPPLLATLTLHVDRVLQDDGLLEEAFRHLWPCFRLWFSPPHDRDGDGWPEWDHLGHPPWPVSWSGSMDGGGIDASLVEDPALAALLYREAASLEEIGGRLGRSEAVRELADRRRQLRSLLPRAWSEDRSTFLRIDREGHTTSTGDLLASGTGPAEVRARHSLAAPSRLTVEVDASPAAASSLRLRIRGRVESGRVRVETITAGDLRWGPDGGRATTGLLFASVETVEPRGLPAGAAWRATTTALAGEDLSLLLPLWAGMVEPERAERIVRRRLTASDGYLRPGGLAMVPGDGSDEAPEPAAGRWIYYPLNLLIGEGLLRYGFQAEAEDLLARMMGGVLASLRRDRALREAVAESSLAGLGKRHHLAGLPPLSLYLDLLGVGLETPRCLRLLARSDGRSGEVRWRGLTIRRGREESVVTFPSGARARVPSDDEVEVEQVDPAAEA